MLAPAVEGAGCSFGPVAPLLVDVARKMDLEICVYIYTHIYTYMYTYICIHICMRVRKRITIIMVFWGWGVGFRL